MSYDIFLRGIPCDKCGQNKDGPWMPSPTYNLSPIFDLALTGEPFPNADIAEAGVVLLGTKTDRPRGLRVLSGKKASDTTVMLSVALFRLADKPEDFKVLEPANGWGDLPGAIEVLEALLEAAKEYPDHVWEIH